MVQLIALIPRVLSILAIVGLLTAQATISLGAAPMSDESMAASSEMTPMPDGMPCCPGQKPAVPDCGKSCPVAVLCMAKCFPGTPGAFAAIPLRPAVVATMMLRDDIWRDLLTEPPPPKPPRA